MPGMHYFDIGERVSVVSSQGSGLLSCRPKSEEESLMRVHGVHNSRRSAAERNHVQPASTGASSAPTQVLWG